MHVPFEIWFLLILWVGGLAWAFGLIEDVWRFCRLRWLKCRAVQTIDRCIVELEMKTLRQCAALRAAGYACEHATNGILFTPELIQELAHALANDHVCAARYTHVPEEQAKHCYITTFSALYFLNRGEVSVTALPLRQKKTAILF
jgi:hypothetical protein